MSYLITSVNQTINIVINNTYNIGGSAPQGHNSNSNTISTPQRVICHRKDYRNKPTEAHDQDWSKFDKVIRYKDGIVGIMNDNTTPEIHLTIECSDWIIVRVPVHNWRKGDPSPNRFKYEWCWNQDEPYRNEKIKWQELGILQLPPIPFEGIIYGDGRQGFTMETKLPRYRIIDQIEHNKIKPIPV